MGWAKEAATVRAETIAKLGEVEARYDQLTRALADPSVLSDPEHYSQLAREHASLRELVTALEEYRRVSREIEEVDALARGGEDPKLRALADAERAALKTGRPALESELERLLLPRDPRDERNVIVE